jgi:hypothetical protein
MYMSLSKSIYSIRGNTRGSMLKKIVLGCAVLLLFFHCLPAVASTYQLQHIRFEAISAHEERVVFRMNRLTEPKFFTMREGTPRLVFDFNDTSLMRGIQNTISTNGQLIQRVRVGIHDRKIRVVLDLVPGRQVQVKQEADGNTLTVIVHEGRISPSAPPPRPSKPEIPPMPPEQSEQVAVPVPQTPSEVSPSSSAATVLSSVTFDKNSNRGEMVMFRLNRFHPPVVFGLEEKKPRVVCDFQQTTAGDRLPDRVAADGKYVQGITLTKEEDEQKIRVVLDLAPDHSYDLQQVFFKNENLFVLIINPLSDS